MSHMPKIVQCAICRNSFVGTTYTLIEHHKECTQNQRQDILFTRKATVRHAPKPKKLLPGATIIDCDGYLEDADEFLDFMWSLPKASGITSFPMVFKDGEYVGGYKELCFQTNVDF